MKSMFVAIAVAAGLSCAAATPAAAAPRKYDCSKPGNANKAACKSSAAAAAKPATPKVTRTSTTTATTTTTSRHYDCTKPGNANKAVCKTAAAESPAGKSPGAVKTTTTSKATTTDCTKWYNKMRAQCRSSTSSAPPRTSVAPSAKPAAGAATAPASPRGTSVNNNPVGATAQCKDGTYSHARTHQGACSRHGGVAKWLS